MAEFLMNYWWLLILIIAAVSIGGYFLYTFIKMPSTAQLTKVKEWLLYAVTAAEKELGGGTGQIKLRYVYDMFVTQFPWAAKVISFELFAKMVDEALDKMREMLKTNPAVAALVEPKPEVLE